MAQDPHLIAIGYQHVKGGEDAFLKAGQDVRAEGGRADKAISALDRVMQGLHARLKETPGFAGAVARALRDVAGQQGPTRFREDVEKTNRSLQQGMRELRAYNQRLREIAAAEARGAGGGDAVLKKFAIDDRVAYATSAMGVGQNSRAGREIRREIEEEERLKQKIQEVARARQEEAAAAEEQARARETVQTNLAGLEREVDDTRRLVAAKKLGEDAYRREVAAIAARNAALKLGAAATQEEIERARRLATELTSLAASGRRTADVFELLPGRLGSFAQILGTLRDRLSGVKVSTALVVGAVAALAAGFIALSAGVSRALDALGPFEQSMRNVQAAAGSTDDELRELSDAALEISQRTRFDPRQAAEGLYALGSAGFTAKEQLAALPQTLAFAEAAQADLGQATETVVGAIKVFNLTAEEAQRVADVFTASLGISSLNADRLQVALRNAGPAANALGQTFEGTMAALSLLTDQFNSGELAGTGLKSALLQLQDKAEKVGIVVKDSAGNFLPLADIIERLEKKGVSGADALKVFGSEAGPTLAALLSKGSAALREAEQKIQATGQAAIVAGKQMDTLEGDTKRLANAQQVFWIRLGEAVSQAQRGQIRDLTDLWARATDWVVAHADEIGKAWEVWTGIATGVLKAVVGVVTWTIDHIDQLKAAVYALAAAWAVLKANALAASFAQLVVSLGSAQAAVLSLTATIRGLTLAFLSSPIGWVAAALGVLVYATQRFIDKTREAHALELERAQAGQEYGRYIDDIRHRTELLTEAEAAHGRQLLENLRLEVEAARGQADALRRRDEEKAFKSQRGLFGGVVDRNVPLTEETQDAESFARDLEVKFGALEQHLARLGGLSDETVNVVASAVDGVGDGIGELDDQVQKAIDALRRGAEEAERMLAAYREGPAAVLATTRAIEIENAVLSSGAKGKAAVEAAELAARTFDARRATDLLRDSDDQARDAAERVAAARAEAADAAARNTVASTAAARAAEVEAWRIGLLFDATDERVAAYARMLRARDEGIRSAQLETAAAQRQLEFSVALRTAEAELTDAKAKSTVASQSLAVTLEIEARLAAEAGRLTPLRIAFIIAETKARAGLIAGIKNQTDAQKKQNASLDPVKRHVEELKKLASVRREDFSTAREYQDALDRVNLQLEIQRRQFDAGALAGSDFAAEIARVAEEEFRLGKQIEKNSKGLTTTEKWASFGEQLSQGFQGASDEVNAVVSNVGKLISGITQATSEVNAFGKAQGFAAAASAIAGLAEAFGLVQNEGPGSFGGRGEGNYSAEGSAVGAVIGGIIGAYFGGAAGAQAGIAIGSAAGGALGSFVKKGAEEAIAEIRLDSGRLAAALSKEEASLGGALVEAGQSINNALFSILDSIGATLIDLPKIGIKVRGDVVSITVGVVNAKFKEMDDAISFAVTEILKQGDIAGLSETIRTVLENTYATSLDELGADLEFGQWYERLGLDDVTVQIENMLSDFRAKVRKVLELGLDAAPVGEWLGQELQGLRDGILGIAKDPEEVLRQNVAAFNSRVALMKAEAELQRADLLMKKAGLDQSVLIFLAKNKIEVAQAERQKAILEATAHLANGQVEIIRGLLNAMAAVDLALTNVDLILANIPDLINDEELQDAINRLNRGNGGGSGAGGDRQQLEDILSDAAWQRSLDGMSAFERELAEVNRRWDEAAVMARGNAELLERVARARQAEVDALRARDREEQKEGLRPYLQDWGKSDWQVKFEEQQRRFEEERERARANGLPQRRINLAEGRANEELGQEAADALNLPLRNTLAQFRELGETLDFLRDNAAALGFTTEEVGAITAQVGQQMYIGLVDGLLRFVDDEGTRRELEQLRYDLEVANLRLQFELLKKMGLLTQEQIDRVEDLFGKLPAAPPSAGDDRDNARDRALQAREERAREAEREADQRARDRQALLDRLRGYEETAFSPAERAYRELERTFDELRQSALRLGVDLAQVQRAHELALRDFWREQLSAIREMREELDFSEFSPLQGAERLSAAQSDFDDLAARALAGDLGAYEALPDAAQRLLDEARAFHNSGVGFQTVFEQVKAVLDALLAGPGNVAGTAAPVLTATQAAAPVQSAQGNVIPFPVVPATSGSPSPAQQSAPVVVINGGTGSESNTKLAAEIADLKKMLLERERENLRQILVSQQIQSQILEAQQQNTEAMQALVGNLERLLARMEAA